MNGGSLGLVHQHSIRFNPESPQPDLQDQFINDFATEAAAAIPDTETARQGAVFFVQSRTTLAVPDGIRERILDKTISLLMTMPGFLS